MKTAALSSLLSSLLALSPQSFGGLSVRGGKAAVLRMSSSMSVAHTPRVLSVQSHTVFGFVGNKAATFPLQTMGFNVDCINTVSLSNHPAYEKGTKGRALEDAALADMVDGLEVNNLLSYDAIITGYTRSQKHLDIIESTVKRVRKLRPDAIYVCDPVLGDNGAYYVPEELTETYKRALLPLATVLKCNMFESQVLSGIEIRSVTDATRACRVLHALGPKICIMTGLTLDSHALDSLTAVISSELSGVQEVYAVTFPKMEGYYAGCGDLFNALTAALYSTLRSLVQSKPALLGEILEVAVEAMRQVMALTKQRGSRELCIIESRDVFAETIAAARARVLNELPHTRPGELGRPALRPEARLVHAHAAPLGIIFDMDGTLTEPGAISFGEMYRRAGIERTTDVDIITLVNRMQDAAARERALSVIREEEMRGCERQRLRAGLHKMLRGLRERKIRVAISTRNCAEAVRRFLEQAQITESHFSPALHRDSLGGINKPDPRVAHNILAEWQVPQERAGQVWFVGDSLDDMLCARAAGCKTVLIDADHNVALGNERPELVDLRVADLDELRHALGLE